MLGGGMRVGTRPSSRARCCGAGSSKKARRCRSAGGSGSERSSSKAAMATALCSGGGAVAVPCPAGQRGELMRPWCTTSSTAAQATAAVTAPPPPAAALLQVTRSNFAAALPALREALASCQFWSFDCEMSGLTLPGQEDYASDDVDDRYVKTAAAAEAFLVTQFGLAAFTWQPDRQAYEARCFNFHLFPQPAGGDDMRFSCQASSLAFLAAHGFDFNKMIYEGVPFTPLAWRDRTAAKAAAAASASASASAASDADSDDEDMTAAAAAAAPAAVPGGGEAAALPPLASLGADEQALLRQLHDVISAWLADEQAGACLYLPAAPTALAALQRAALAAGVGSSRWQGGELSSSSRSSSTSSSSSSSSSREQLYCVEDASSSGAGAMLRRASAQQLAQAAAAAGAAAADAAAAAAGFSVVFELLRESGKPAVGHNVRYDLAFCLAAFVQRPLPKTWPAFKDLVGAWFPGGVLDTKHLARVLEAGGTEDDGAGAGPDGTGPALLPDTSLGMLFRCMARGDLAAPQPMASGDGSSSSRQALAGWLAEHCKHLDSPAAWATLPPVRLAPGCEEYAAAAAGAAAGAGTGAAGTAEAAVPAAAAADGLAHEAGYDALMTGLVFIGLLRLHEIAGLSQLSRWALPAGPASPPDLAAVQAHVWRQHSARLPDMPCAVLQGPDPAPARPHVVFVTSFPSGTKWHDIQRRFTQLGLGRPPVSLVRAAGGLVTGAYVIMSSPKAASRAIQVVRQSKWRVDIMSYADYFYSKHGRGGGASSSSSSKLAGGAADVSASGGSAGATTGEGAAGDSSSSGSSTSTSSGAQGLQALGEELQRRTARALQQRQAQQQLQQAQQQLEQPQQQLDQQQAGAADGSSSSKQQQPPAESAGSRTSSTSSSSSSQGVSVQPPAAAAAAVPPPAPDMARRAALDEVALRLDALRRQQAAAGSGAGGLKRPALRPPP